MKYLALIFVLLIPMTAFAQTDLDETFSTDEFSFSYSSEWTPNENSDNLIAIMFGELEGGFIFDLPIASTGEQGNSGGFAIESESMVMGIFPHLVEKATQSSEGLALGLVEAMIDDDALFSEHEIITYELNGHPMTNVILYSPIGLLDIGVTTLELASGQFVSTIVMGTFEQVNLALPLTFEVLNTVRLTDDETPVGEMNLLAILPESYVRPDGTAEFAYPSDWVVDEANGYSLVTAPNGVSVGISIEPLPIPSTGDPAADMVGLIRDNVRNGAPSADISEIIIFDLGGKHGARIDASIETELGIFMAIDLGDELLALVSVIGPADLIAQMDTTIMSIAASVEIPKDDGK